MQAKLFFSLLILVFLGGSCRSIDPLPQPATLATILEVDKRLCACCGGYRVALGEVTDVINYTGDFFQWDGQVDGVMYTDSLVLPALVQIDYELDSVRCAASEGWMTIENLELP